MGLIGGRGAFASEVLTGTGEVDAGGVFAASGVFDASGELSAGGDVPDVVSEEVDACACGELLSFAGGSASSASSQ